MLPLFQSLVIKDKAFCDKFLERFGCPDSELCCLCGIYPVADGNDSLKIEKINITGYLTITLLLNYPEIPDSCLTG